MHIEISCPYLDCKNAYQAESAQVLSLRASLCPKCNRSGRAKPLEIISKLKAKEERINSHTNQSEGIAEPALFQALLEDIRSLWNVGSIFRTADATGISKLYLCGITGYPPRNEISKTALGAEEDISWQYFAQTLEAVADIKSKGIIIIGLERNSDSIDIVDIIKQKKFNKPFCLAVGNEVSGLSPELIANCDYLCELPMKGKKESLNVASAFAAAAYLINEFN